MKDEELILKAVEYCNDIPARVRDFLRDQTKEEPKPEFKVGDWIIGEAEYNPTYPARIIRILGDHADLDIEKVGADYCWRCGKSVYWRLATPQEIESHLRKIAEEKGFFKNGTKFKSINQNEVGSIRTIKPFRGNVDIKWVYHDSNDSLFCCNGMDTKSIDGKYVCSNPSIYEGGKWAEIIPEKKKLPSTKD